MNLSMREKVLMLTLCLVVIIFLGLKLLIFPAMDTLSYDKSKLLQVQPKTSNAQANILMVKSVDIKIQKAYEDAKTAAVPLLPTLDKPSLNEWLFYLAEANGLIVQTTFFYNPTTTGNASDPTAASTSNDNNNLTNLSYTMKTCADQYLGKSSSQNTKTSASGKSGEADAIMSTVTMQVAGNYSDFKSFLDAIRDTKRSIVVSAFNCLKQNNTLTCSLTLQFYAAEKLDNSDSIFDWKLPNPSGQKDLM